MSDALVTFEVELLGGGVERRYRKTRPEVEALPWGSLDASLYDEPVRHAACSAWTRAAFQEHRTADAIAIALQALVEAQAPLDLIAMATRFPLDEVVHVELCARMAALFGGGTEVRYRPNELLRAPEPTLPPLLRAADVVVRVFCVGEALSIPLLRGAWQAAVHPLSKAVLGTIVRDEAAHGTFGWWFLDWALPQLGPSEREVLAGSAERAMAPIRALWREVEREPPPLDSEAHPLGWLRSDRYLALAHEAMEKQVRTPLRERGIVVPRPR